MTALEKQIQASEKRLAKFEKNVGMYRERADKKLALLQKNGFMVTREDFSITKSGKWKYDYDYTVSDKLKNSANFAQWYPVIDNMLQERENADRADNERKVLEDLKKNVQEKMEETERKKNMDLPLVQKLAVAFGPYREEWKNQMMEWHGTFYDRIHEKLPDARMQYDKLRNEINVLMKNNGYRPTSQIKQLEQKKMFFGRIISSPPASYTSKEAYLQVTAGTLEQEFDDNISMLADKCRKFGLNLEKVQVQHPRMSQRGFDVLLSDEKDRVVDARMIWAAEDSEYVSMHTRYIVTERKLEQTVENGNQIKNESVMKDNLEEAPAREKDTKDRITDIEIFADKDNNRFIHCEIDGEKKQAKKLNEWDNSTFSDRTDKMRLASIYFSQELHEGSVKDKGVQQDTDALLMDALTDIAMYAGWKRLEFEDSKLRSRTLQDWAKEFVDKYAGADWETADYIDLVDNFAEKKVNDWLRMHPVQPGYINRISEVNVFSGRDGGKYIRCKVDGEQQTAVKLSFADTVKFNDRTDRLDLAARYFKDVLQNAVQQDKGIRR